MAQGLAEVLFRIAAVYRCRAATKNGSARSLTRIKLARRRTPRRARAERRKSPSTRQARWSRRARVPQPRREGGPAKPRAGGGFARVHRRGFDPSRIDTGRGRFAIVAALRNLIAQERLLLVSAKHCKSQITHPPRRDHLPHELRGVNEVASAPVVISPNTTSWALRPANMTAIRVRR